MSDPCRDCGATEAPHIPGCHCDRFLFTVPTPRPSRWSRPCTFCGATRIGRKINHTNTCAITVRRVLRELLG